MHVLFFHRAFPSQFGHLAVEFARRYGWRCSFLTEEPGNCPPPSADLLANVDLHTLPPDASGLGRGTTHWMRAHEVALQLARRSAAYLRGRPDLRPDLVVGHCGLGPVLFLDEVLDCPAISYCEWYHAVRHADLTYRVDLPPVSIAPFYPRAINVTTLMGLLGSDSGYSATEVQRRSFPARFRDGLEVHFDGIDTELYRPRPREPLRVAGRSITAETKLVTFVARGLESIRGFDLFCALAKRLTEARPDVLVAVAGSDWSYYAWDRLQTGRDRFRDWALERSPVDPDRIAFLGHVEPEQLARLLSRSDLHVYLTVPFVPSWSLFDALSSGAIVLAGDVSAARELIEPGVNGLLAPLFDVDAQADQALRVLEAPADHEPIRRAARDLAVERYGLDACIPPLHEYYERVASASRRS